MRGFAPDAEEKVSQEIRAVRDTNKMVAQGTHGSRMMTGNTELRCSRPRGERKEVRKAAVTTEGREIGPWVVSRLDLQAYSDTPSPSPSCRISVTFASCRQCGWDKNWIALVKVMESHYEVTEAVDNVLSNRPWLVLSSSGSSDCVVVSWCHWCAGRDVIVRRPWYELVAVGVSM